MFTFKEIFEGGYLGSMIWLGKPVTWANTDPKCPMK